MREPLRARSRDDGFDRGAASIDRKGEPSTGGRREDALGANPSLRRAFAAGVARLSLAVIIVIIIAFVFDPLGGGLGVALGFWRYGQRADLHNNPDGQFDD